MHLKLVPFVYLEIVSEVTQSNINDKSITFSSVVYSNK